MTRRGLVRIEPDDALVRSAWKVQVGADTLGAAARRRVVDALSSVTADALMSGPKPMERVSAAVVRRWRLLAEGRRDEAAGAIAAAADLRRALQRTSHRLVGVDADSAERLRRGLSQ